MKIWLSIAVIAIISTHQTADATSVGRTAGQFGVSPIGAAQYSIPIWVPPGPRGIQPQISLFYNSQSTIGPLGIGWSLAGLGQITRCNRTQAQDGSPGAVTLATSDGYCLSGKRLRLTSASGTYGAAGSTYQTEVADFSNVTAYSSSGVTGIGYFLVQGLNGLNYYYGYTDSYGNGANSAALAKGTTTVLTWFLSKVVDRAGNNYVINYLAPSTTLTGTSVPNKILWTPATAGSSSYTYTMQFNYGPSPNSPQSSINEYVAGTLVSDTELLTSIEILSGSTVVKDYFLGYLPSPLTQRKELSTVTECADAGESNCIIPTSVGYQSGTPGLSTTSNTAVSSGAYDLTARYDFNGDGYPDLVYMSSSGVWYVAFGSASGYSAPVNTGIPANATAVFGKITGGIEDGILASKSGTWWYYTWNGTSFVGTSTGIALDPSGAQYQLADFNGDGLPDLITLDVVVHNSGVSSETIYVNLNTSSGGTASFSSTLTSAYSAAGNNGAGLQTPDLQNGKLRRFDFNGDGLDDLVFVVFSGTNTVTTYELISTGSVYNATLIASTTGVSLPPVYFTNWNDDKCTDFVTSNVLYVSACNGTTAQSYSLTGTVVQALDWDGDGRTDLMVINGSTLGVYLSQANGTLALTTTSIPYSSTCTYLWMDANGDGLDDLGCWTQTGTKGLTYYLHNGTSDLATTFADGYENSASPTYLPLTETSYTSGPLTFPDAPYSGPMYVVTKATFSDPSSAGSTYNQTFSYFNGGINQWGRGFDGFGEVSTLDSRNNVTDSKYYELLFPYTGMVNQEITQNGAANLVKANGSVSETILSSTTNEQRYFPYFNNWTVSRWDIGYPSSGNPVTTTSTNYTYDNYGNATTVAASVTDNDPNSPYVNDVWSSTTVSTIAPNTGTWCLNLPTEVDTTNTPPSSLGAPAITRHVSYVSPDYTNCRQTEQVVEQGSSTYQVTTGYTYGDSFGNLTGQTVTGIGMASRTSSVVYGTTGQFPTSITNALTQVTQTNYDPNSGHLLSIKDPNGIQMSWQYDPFQRRNLETRADNTSTTWSYNNCTTGGCVNSNNKMTVTKTIVNVGGTTQSVTNTYLDSVDRTLVTSSTMLNGAFDRNEVQYNSLGLVAQRGAPCAFVSCTNYWATYSYDVLNRITQSQRPISATNGNLQTTTYGYQGRTTTVTDPYNKVTTKITKVTGNLARTKDNNGYYVNFSHDAFGSVLSVTDSLSNTLRTQVYAYGIKPFRTSWTDMDLGSRSFTIDALGEITAYSDGKGQNFSATYDALSRPASRTEPDLTTTWTWGTTASSYNIGKLASVSSVAMAGTHTDSYTYDSAGRLLDHTIVNPSDGSRSFDYAYSTTTGLLTSLFYPFSYPSTLRVEVGYNYQNGILQQIVDLSTSTVWWQANSMNPRGEITQETAQALSTDPQIVTTRAYDAVTGWLGSIQAGVGGGSTLQNQAYLYDEMGNVTDRQDYNLGLTENFYYDNLYRLYYSTLGSVTNLQMCYDNTGGACTENLAGMGNISSRSDVAGGAAWTYDPARKHAVTQAGSSSYTYAYDANGNVTSRNGSAIGWTSYNYPSGVGTSTESATFDYGPDRQRWRMIYTGSAGIETTYYATPLFEVVHTSSLTDYRHYIFAGGRAVMQLARSVDGANQRPLLTDHQGSISTIMHGTGTSFVNESFTAYGNRREASTWTGNPTSAELANMISITRQGYTFQTVLGSMDLIHMNGRVEDSFTGRFLSPDPHVPDPGNTQGYNRYGYVNNNPLTFVDPTGFYCGEPPATPAPDVLGLGYGGDPAGDSAPVEEVTVTSACVPFPTYDFPSPVISWPGIPSLPLPKPVSVAPEQSVNPCPPARLSPRGLHPRVQSMADQLLDDLSSQGLNGRLGQTLRTFAQQNQLYAQGRTVPGPIVTNAQGGQSIHNFGLAFDIQMFDPSGNYITNGSDPAYSTAGQIGQNLGLEWGGNWSSIFDPSHFQYTGGLTLAQILANYNAGVDPLCHTQ